MLEKRIVGDMGKEKVFVSYSWKDRDQVNNIISELKANRYDVIDDDSIPIGSDFARTLGELISSADIVIVFYSENYSYSQFASNELSFAIANHKTVIPIVVGDVLLPFYLQIIQYIKVKDLMKPHE